MTSLLTMGRGVRGVGAVNVFCFRAHTCVRVCVREADCMHFCIVLAEIEPFNNKCEPFSNIPSHCSARAAGNTAFRIGKYGRSYLPAWAVADAFKGSENAMNHVGVRPPVCACVDVFGQATPTRVH